MLSRWGIKYSPVQKVAQFLTQVFPKFYYLHQSFLFFQFWTSGFVHTHYYLWIPESLLPWHSVHPTPFLLGVVEPPTKFSKIGGGGGAPLDRTSTLRGGCWKRGGCFFSGGLAIFTKKKLKSEILNDKNSL